MVSRELLNALVCPLTQRRLARADDELLARLNAAIDERRIKNKAGRTIEARLDGLLVREDGALAYAVVDEIPMMLADEAIPLGQLDEPPTPQP